MATAGRLRNRIEVQEQVQVGVSGLNTPVMDWVTWRRPWCVIADRRGNEHFENGQIYEEVRRIFSVRALDARGIDASMRILFMGQVHNIKAILPDYQRTDMTNIECAVQDQVVSPSTLRILGVPQTEASVGDNYTMFVQASGGQEPYAFSVASGDLPAGITLSEYNGNVWSLKGAPEAPGTFSGIVLRVSDGAGKAADLDAFTIEVAEE